MEKDYILNLGLLSFGTRLLRIYESLMDQGQMVYDENGVSFRPKWFALIKLIESKGATPIAECAQEIGISHPAIIKQANELIKLKLITKKPSKTDKRVTLLSLTPQGEKRLRELEEVWNRMTKAYQRIEHEHGISLLKIIGQLEEAFADDNFFLKSLT